MSDTSKQTLPEENKIPVEIPQDVTKEEVPDEHRGKKCCKNFKSYVDSARTCAAQSLTSTCNFLTNSTKCLYTNTVNATQCALQSLKNPVVLINVLIGVSSLSTVLVGYIKYEKRFLKGKSEAFIWTSIIGATTFLTLDGYLSKKYYKKYE